MKLFIQGIGYQIWEIILDEPLVVYKNLPIEQHSKAMSTNAWVRNILTNKLDIKEYSKVMACKIVKEVWDKL